MDRLSFNAMVQEITRHVRVGHEVHIAWLGDMRTAFDTNRTLTDALAQTLTESLYDQPPRPVLSYDDVESIKVIKHDEIQFSCTCPLCLEDMIETESLVELTTCHHAYHHDCIVQSLQAGYDACAVCSTKLLFRHKDRPRKRQRRNYASRPSGDRASAPTSE